MPALAKIDLVQQPGPPADQPLTDDVPYVRVGLAALTVTFVFLLAWSALAPLRSAVVTNGRLVAASDNRTVEHLDGGLIDEILVRDGDRVAAGQILLRLDPKPLQIQRENVDNQLFEIQANLERLAAERQGQETLAFTPTLTGQADSDFEREILTTQQTLFETRQQAMVAEREMLAQRAKQAKTKITGLNDVVGSLRRRVALLDEDLRGLKKLNAGKLVSASRLRESQRRRSELVGEIAEHDGEASSLAETVRENEQRIDLRQKEYQREVAGKLREMQAKLISLKAARQAVTDKLARIEITAPATGTIKGFDIVTTGAVVNAGDPILQIVPADSQYRIQARISPMDVDVLHPGMHAEVRLAGIDGANNFPVIYAELESVSADAYTDNHRDESYYKALFSMPEEAMSVLTEEGARLIPGMPTDLYIETGERTLLDYLTRPLQDLFARALNEA